MMERYRLHIRNDGKVEILGIDQPPAILHHGSETSRHVVLKVPGHKYWSGRGEQSYAPAEFQVYTRTDDGHQHGKWYLGVVTFPVRAP